MIDFNSLKDTKKPKPVWHSIAIPKDVNDELDIIARELKCKKTQIIKAALEDVIKEYWSPHVKDNRD